MTFEDCCYNQPWFCVDSIQHNLYIISKPNQLNLIHEEVMWTAQFKAHFFNDALFLSNPHFILIFKSKTEKYSEAW